MTHDLLKSILQGAGVIFEKVLVSELKERTYYARIFLTSAGKDFEVDSRPSDAIALALRFRKPILVARSLMEGDTALDLQDRSEPVVESVRGITVQEISQGLAASLGLDEQGGGAGFQRRRERECRSEERGCHPGRRFGTRSPMSPVFSNPCCPVWRGSLSGCGCAGTARSRWWSCCQSREGIAGAPGVSPGSFEPAPFPAAVASELIAGSPNTTACPKRRQAHSSSQECSPSGEKCGPAMAAPSQRAILQ